MHEFGIFVVRMNWRVEILPKTMPNESNACGQHPAYTLHTQHILLFWISSVCFVYIWIKNFVIFWPKKKNELQQRHRFKAHLNSSRNFFVSFIFEVDLIFFAFIYSWAMYECVVCLCIQSRNSIFEKHNAIYTHITHASALIHILYSYSNF